MTPGGDREALLAERTRERAAARLIAWAGEKAQVAEVGESRFKLTAQGGKVEASFPYGSLPEPSAQVLDLARRPRSAEDAYDLMVFCFEHELFTQALRAATAARKLDKAVAARLPNIDVLRYASRPPPSPATSAGARRPATRASGASGRAPRRSPSRGRGSSSRARRRSSRNSTRSASTSA